MAKVMTPNTIESQEITIIVDALPAPARKYLHGMVLRVADVALRGEEKPARRAARSREVREP